jgi:DNA-binding Lrp family transcriptional regulator
MPSHTLNALSQTAPVAVMSPARLSELDKHLLNDYQRNFPLTPRPFAAIARQRHSSENEVITRLSALLERGAISRIGPVFRPHRVGTSTLAAMAVPDGRLLSVAELINSYPQVNHNYERQHRLNLWFVITAANQRILEQTLASIEQRSGYAVLSLPMLADYHIDLGFQLGLHNRQPSPTVSGHSGSQPDADHALPRSASTGACPGQYRELIAAVQHGLPLTGRPFLTIAKQLGIGEREVIDQLTQLLADGHIKRLGIVVRHHELGFRANAMVVWNVADEVVDKLGHCIGKFEFVTLCYQRARHAHDWPYNLYCMIHGRDRESVLERIDEVRGRCGLRQVPYEILFSRRRFKQRGAHYMDTVPSTGKRHLKQEP